MHAIILAGGFGTRLQTVVNDVPKPMADINGKPFLDYLVNHYNKQNIDEFIFSIGYKSEIIKQYFRKNKKISYSIEDYPLGTGGAIKSILELNKSLNNEYIVLNGDTFLDISLENLSKFHYNNNNDISIALLPMENFDRYGSVEIENNKVISFNEKSYCKKGLINTGVYIINDTIFNNSKLPENFSFESFLSDNISTLKIGGLVFENSYFIDIGIPLDYKKAIVDFKNINI